MSIYQPYFYVIQDVFNQMYYAGVKWGKDSNPEKLLKEDGYLTSSNKVRNIIDEYGIERFAIRKIRTFETAEDARKYECRFLVKVDAKNNPKFYNLHNSDLLFSYHDEEYKSVMKAKYGVEHPSHSIELRSKVAKNNIKKYGVENVFQSDLIKDRIKQTNLEKYGVEHPSYSKELLDKKLKNNLEKYGVKCNLNLEHVKDKAAKSIRSPEVKKKRAETNLKKYGHVTPSCNRIVKEKIQKTREKLSERYSVKLIREYCRYFNITLGRGWYQKSDEEIEKILFDLQSKYGYYEYDVIRNIKPEKRYSSSIKKLQQRPVVLEIKKYKKKYGRKLKLGRSWDRKTEKELQKIVEKLKVEYGDLED